MTNESGQTVVDSRAGEIADYVEQVRAALGDLPLRAREDLLEDLPAHLAEVAAEDPVPLADRLGPPAAYAAELRAAADPAADPAPRSAAERWRARWDRTRDGLGRLDHRAGPLLGYERVSEFGRLLVPAWWVLRGYLVAMLAVTLVDRHGQLGLLPRLGGSTLVALAILAAVIAGSVWLGRRTPDLSQWQRRGVGVAGAFLVLFGFAGFAGVDENERWGWPGVTEYVSDNPYGGVQDVYPVDGEGRLLTDVTLLDQDGNPLDIGWISCDEVLDQFDPVPAVTYPRCPGEAPWWLPAPGEGVGPAE
jgi:hypothetical protein